MSRPLISKQNSWFNFEKITLEVFTLALKKLHQKSRLPIVEDDLRKNSLNRTLSYCLLEAINDWEKINDTDIPTTPKSNLGKQLNLDLPEDFNDYERTKPDFQWEFRDRLGSQNSLNSIFKNYDIECKRVGNDISSSRNLSKEYVYKGVSRFIQRTHCYGQYTDSGLMIGYVQDAELQVILSEVNKALKSASLPEILLSSMGWEVDISRLDHRLERLDIDTNQFNLTHLWVDLRHHYTKSHSPQTDEIEKRSKKKEASSPRNVSTKL